jgi:hypothetical protein
MMACENVAKTDIGLLIYNAALVIAINNPCVTDGLLSAL